MRINVTIPDDIYKEMKDKGINISKFLRDSWHNQSLTIGGANNISMSDIKLLKKYYHISLNNDVRSSHYFPLLKAFCKKYNISEEDAIEMVK